jgi:hypothetical protein
MKNKRFLIGIRLIANCAGDNRADDFSFLSVGALERVNLLLSFLE